jgi:hypothetical protein
MRKMVRAGAGATIFDMQEPEPHKNGPAPKHWLGVHTPMNFFRVGVRGSSFLGQAILGLRNSKTAFPIHLLSLTCKIIMIF